MLAKHLIKISPPSIVRGLRWHSSITSAMAPPKDYDSIRAFHDKLLKSKRILAVCGAGLSAASGLPTFRGAGGLWRNHNAVQLATPEAFLDDPGLVWLFYAYRRHMALQVKPNAGHHALAALAKHNPDFLCLSQNVDNLHTRANHPLSQLQLLHGSLFALKCSRQPMCTWTDPYNDADPLCPSLAAAADDNDPTLLDASKPLAPIPTSALPHCPECEEGLQRPGVVWFGEPLDDSMLDDIEAWIDRDVVDMVIVVGTSSVVWPAAGFAEQARTRGKTSVVTVNMERSVAGMEEGDFMFTGDAASLLPELLRPVIGDLSGFEKK